MKEHNCCFIKITDENKFCNNNFVECNCQVKIFLELIAHNQGNLNVLYIAYVKNFFDILTNCCKQFDVIMKV